MPYAASSLNKITFFHILSFLKSPEFFPFIIFCLIILILGYIIRVNQIKSSKRKLAFLVEKRTKTISKQKNQIAEQNRLVKLERDKSDELLSNVLPLNIVQELKSKGQVEIKSYQNVSVVFIDIVGFTKIAERNNPTYLVNKLNELFSEYDSISEKYNLEKIKTIGDAYLAVGGFGDHPELSSINCVSAALEIQLLMKNLREIAVSKNEEFWEVRIGIHNGDVIAGVLGTKRIAYDIFGNTVNIAKRIESNSAPGKVNISESTYKVVKTFFDCSSRGEIATKNTGEIYMYYVNGIDSAFSFDEAFSFSNWFREYKEFSAKSKIDIYGLEEYGFSFLTKKLAKNLYYHGPHHTKDVLNAVEKGLFRIDEIEYYNDLLYMVTSHEVLKPYYKKGAIIFNEQNILVPNACFVRPDRIIKSSEGWVIIDYKTGKYRPKHEDQLRQYEEVLNRFETKVFKKYLVYIDDEIEVKNI